MLGVDWLSNFTVFGGGAIALITGLFGLGYSFNGRIKYACAEATKDMVKIMTDMAARLDRLEQVHVPISRYERDLVDLKDLIKEVHNDVKMGLQALSTRIDTLMRPVV